MTEDSQRLRVYADLIRTWAPRLDLVAPGDMDRLEERHIEDSLRLVPLLDTLPPGACIDVGSGAGLPGVPLAIVSGRRWRFLEPRAKRAAFLEEVVRRLDLDCEVLTLTAEQAARERALQGAHVAATARALSAPRDAFAKLLPLVSQGGVAAVWLGESAKVPQGAEEWKPGIATMQIPTDDMEGTS